jgi:hypothetical protein
MNNFFLEAIAILKKQRGGQALTGDEQTMLNAAVLAVDKSPYDELPTEQALQKLAILLDPSLAGLCRKSWLSGGTNGSFPLARDIRIDGRIAELVTAARKSYPCRYCPQTIILGEPHYIVSWAGAGLGSIKFPSRLHASCLPDYLEQPVRAEEWQYLWGLMFDYAALKCRWLQEHHKLDGYIAGMMHIWSKSGGVRNKPTAEEVVDSTILNPFWKLQIHY